MLIGYIMLNTGVYILSSKKNPPLPSKFFPVFVDFFRSFKLHKGILTCVLSLFSFFLLPPPFSLPFFKFFKFFPIFQFGQKIPPPPGGEWPEYIYLAQYLPGTYQMILINGSDLNQWYLIQVVSAGSHPRWRCRRRRYWFPVYETSHPK